MSDLAQTCLYCKTSIGEAGSMSAKDDLILSLSKYQTLLSECEELETQIKPMSSFPISEPPVSKKRSFMKYFWPYIIVAAVGFYVTYIGTTLVTISSTSNLAKSQIRPNAQALSNRLMTETVIGWVVAILIALTVVIIGIKISKRKQADFNREAARMTVELQERYQKGLRNQKMITIYEENERMMRQYEPLVPEEYRTSAFVGQIVNLLKEDKAQTVNEAIELL